MDKHIDKARNATVWDQVQDEMVYEETFCKVKDIKIPYIYYQIFKFLWTSWPLLGAPKDFLLLIILVIFIEGKASPTHKASCKQVQLQRVLSLPRHYKGVLEKYSVIKYTKCQDFYPKDCAHRQITDKRTLWLCNWFGPVGPIQWKSQTLQKEALQETVYIWRHWH